MKNLEVNQMERLTGGGWFGCTAGILGGVVGLATGNVMMLVAGIYIAGESC